MTDEEAWVESEEMVTEGLPAKVDADHIAFVRERLRPLINAAMKRRSAADFLSYF
jgi:hypothetical protein